MVTVSRQALLPFLAPILAPTVPFVLAPIPLQAAEIPFFLLATAPTERHSPPVWLDDLSWPTSHNGSSRIGDRTTKGRRSNLKLQ